MVPACPPSNSMTHQEEELNLPSLQMEQPSLDPWLEEEEKKRKMKKEKRQVLLEGYVETGEAGEEEEGVKSMARTKSLTGDDLDELKGCLDLGFGFSYEEIPELCSTLPALELCYSMSRRFLDEQQQRGSEVAPAASSQMCSSASSSGPIANWRISGPGMCLTFCSLCVFFLMFWIINS